MFTIDLIFHRSGGGHVSTVRALVNAIQALQPSWSVNLIDIQEIGFLDVIDPIYQLTGVDGVDIYNFMLKRGLTLFSPLYYSLVRRNIRRTHRQGVSFWKNYYRRHPVDLVVSCIPTMNRMLGESLQNLTPAIPFVTLMTDFADSPPNFWIESAQEIEQYLICPTEQAVQQAKSLGHSDEKIYKTAGILIDSKFYMSSQFDRNGERQRLGLQPDLPTGIVMFGAQGSDLMRSIADLIQCSSLDIQLIFLCGHNQKLANILKCKQYRYPFHVEAFTTDISYFMALSDFFIGKPGNVSISEAVAMNLPVITLRNSSTLRQERYCCEWILDNHFGIVIQNLSQIHKAIATLLDPHNFKQYQAHIRKRRNVVAAEVISILEKILIAQEKTKFFHAVKR